MNPAGIRLKSNIHRARVTEVNLACEGSITIARRLTEEAGILPFERVQVPDTEDASV